MGQIWPVSIKLDFRSTSKENGDFRELNWNCEAVHSITVFIFKGL